MAADQPPWPREWLMTDERLGDRLWEAIDALPTGAGIVYRHYSLAEEPRRDLGERVAIAARQRGLMLAVAGSRMLAEELGANIMHNSYGDPGTLPESRSVHSLEEAVSACSAGAALLFVSPIHETRSHPGQRPLGPTEAVRIARSCHVPAIALGGVNRDNFAPLERDGFYGWAGIDAWLKGAART